MSLPGSTVLVTSVDSGLEDRWLYGDWPLAALPSGWWCSASGQALPGCPCPGGARPPPSVAPWPVRAKPQLPSGRSSHQRILFHIRARQSEPWGRCCCLLPAGAAPPPGSPLPLVPPALGSLAGVLLAARGRAGGAAPAHSLQRSGRAAWAEISVAQEGASPCPGEAPRAWQRAPKVAWARVAHRAGGTRGCSPELRCSSGPPASGSPHCTRAQPPCALPIPLPRKPSG